MRSLGKIVMTRGIASYMKDIAFKMAVNSALTRFAQKDWGDVCADDAALNNQALIDGDQILGAYQSPAGKIWLVANFYEKDYIEKVFKEKVGSEPREDGLVMVVTVLFPSEY